MRSSATPLALGALGAFVGAVEALRLVHAARLDGGVAETAGTVASLVGLDGGIGLVIGLLAGRFVRPIPSAVAWVAAALALLTLVAAVGEPATHPGTRSSARPAAPDLVLVTIDTLRRDHVGAFGGETSTPVLDDLARTGSMYTDAVAELPETLLSHTSMLTGLSPDEHAVLANGGIVTAGIETITLSLAAAGWATGAFVSSYVLDARAGLDRGFDIYDDALAPCVPLAFRALAPAAAMRLLLRSGRAADASLVLERTAPATIARALAWASRQDRPIFLWVHLFEPHAPYMPHDGRGPGVDAIDHRRILAAEPGYAYSESEIGQLRALYAGEVEYIDNQVGVLLAGLRRTGHLRHARVILTGDHGESLGEHGIAFNHHGVYESVVRVPLIVWSSEGSPATIDRTVTLSQVGPTLLDLAGLPPVAGSASLLGPGSPGRIVALQGRLAAGRAAGRVWGARSWDGRKLIRGDHGDETYELRADPEETQPSAAIDDGDLREALRGAAHTASATPTPADEETRERLRALGYAW